MTAGPCEAEAIRRGEAPKWVAVARGIDALSARSTALLEAVHNRLEDVERLAAELTTAEAALEAMKDAALA